MVPGRPSALAKWLRPAATFPDYMQKAAGDIYGGEARRDPKLMSAHTARIIPRNSWATFFNCLPGWDGPHPVAASNPATHLVMAGLKIPWSLPKLQDYSMLIPIPLFISRGRPPLISTP